MTEIPAQLVGTKRFIKVEKQSKDPKTSPEGPFFAADDTELQNWIQNGGNVGLSLGKLVALDIDTDRFRALASQHLLETFTVRSGGGGEHWYYQSDWSGKRTFTGESQNELGSIRSGIWYTVVPPSIHDETGDRYRILQDREVQRVPASQIQSFAGGPLLDSADTGVARSPTIIRHAEYLLVVCHRGRESRHSVLPSRPFRGSTRLSDIHVHDTRSTRSHVGSALEYSKHYPQHAPHT